MPKPALIVLEIQGNPLKHARVVTISKKVLWKEEEKEGEEKYKENKMSFEGTNLRNSLADFAQLWNLRCPTLREFAQKIMYFCWGSVELQMLANRVFFTPVNTLLCVLKYSLQSILLCVGVGLMKRIHKFHAFFVVEISKNIVKSRHFWLWHSATLSFIGEPHWGSSHLVHLTIYENLHNKMESPPLVVLNGTSDHSREFT